MKLQENIKYIGYRHLKEGRMIERIIFSTSLDGQFITMKTAIGEDSASSFSDGDFGVIVSGDGDFISAFFLDIDLPEKEFIVGVWAGRSLTSEGQYQSGRIILAKAQETDEEKMRPIFLKYDATNNLLEENTINASTFDCFRRYFLDNSDLALPSTSKFYDVHRRINSLVDSFEVGLHELRGLSSQLSQDLNDLKQIIVKNGQEDNYKNLDLKNCVIKGELNIVLEKIKQVIAKTPNIDILNDFLLYYHSDSRVEQQLAKGLINYSDYNIEKNRITKGLLLIIDALPVSG